MHVPAGPSVWTQCMRRRRRRRLRGRASRGAALYARTYLDEACTPHVHRPAMHGSTSSSTQREAGGADIYVHACASSYRTHAGAKSCASSSHSHARQVCGCGCHLTPVDCVDVVPLHPRVCMYLQPGDGCMEPRSYRPWRGRDTASPCREGI